MTPNEVFRTAHKWVPNSLGDLSLGKGLPDGINQVCPSCKAGSIIDGGKKAGHVERILDPVYLKPWPDFYTSGLNEFKAYECYSCGAKWSVFKPKE
jgi:hypothetical protein